MSDRRLDVVRHDLLHRYDAEQRCCMSHIIRWILWTVYPVSHVNINCFFIYTKISIVQT